MTEPAAAVRPSDHVTSSQTGSLTAPVVGGVLGAAALIALYLGLITVAESWRHALDQLRTDAIWVGLVALGLSVQVGLYIRVRQVVRRGAAAGGALTGAGTGTSTAGMIACCAHHLADIAPFIGLTGATAFLNQYRFAFITAGLAVNLVGIAFSVRTLRRVLEHRRSMNEEAASGAACH